MHYLGYVEEDETPEAIMKKFEELEKVRALLCSDDSKQQRSLAAKALACGAFVAQVMRWSLCTGDGRGRRCQRGAA